MRQINPFFLIGTIGILFTSMLHIVIGAITSEEAAASAFWVLYPAFSGFLLAGTYIMMKRKDPLRE